MYKDAYPTNNGKVQISVVQIIVVVLTLVVTFVIPARAISYYRDLQTTQPYTQQALALRNQQSGRVAGASTSNGIIHIPLVNVDINLNTQAGILMIGALLLTGVALIIVIYLLISPRKRARLQ